MKEKPQDIYADIESDLNLLFSSLPDDQSHSLVEVGEIFWQVQNQAGRYLNKVKERLRAKALKKPKASTHTFSGENVAATVTMPSESWVLRDGTDLGQLRKMLGVDFDQFFETEVKPHPKFAARVHAADPQQKALLHAAVDSKPHIPRVSFRRSGV